MKRIVVGADRTVKGIAKTGATVVAITAFLESSRTNALLEDDTPDQYHGERTVRSE
ncbi:hypothetical protein [Natrialba sp. INN-245]|uniref:hypothetical protein n=1 Tax=Natrialba sp. INN-245 TaxID=2690967 RepID=UPI00131277FE|nr:hypothetical protein [Natrialba sp. INN-245]MWV39220.1 hypothetical protein [Natrialba sp. INN-245]